MYQVFSTSLSDFINRLEFFKKIFFNFSRAPVWGVAITISLVINCYRVTVDSTNKSFDEVYFAQKNFFTIKVMALQDQYVRIMDTSEQREKLNFVFRTVHDHSYQSDSSV